jgi:hypothetical protein
VFRFYFAILSYAESMYWRQCEVVLLLPRRPAILCRRARRKCLSGLPRLSDHCNNRPRELKRPHVSADSKLELMSRKIIETKRCSGSGFIAARQQA